VDLEQLGGLIHYKREEAGIPLSTAAKRAGIGRSTLWIIERGENPQTGNPSRPSKETIERLAQALHMSQAETEELLSLADYTVARPPEDARASLLPTTTPTITEINGTVYYAHDGYLEAFDATTGNPCWPAPARTGRAYENATNLSIIPGKNKQLIANPQAELSAFRQELIAKGKKNAQKLTETLGIPKEDVSLMIAAFSRNYLSEHFLEEIIRFGEIEKELQVVPGSLRENADSTLLSSQEQTADEPIKVASDSNIRTIYKEALEGTEVRVLATLSDVAEELFRSDLFDNGKLFENALRNNKRLTIYEIYRDSPKAIKHFDYTANSSRYHYKFLPSNINLESSVYLIFKNRVGIINFKEIPRAVVVYDTYFYNSFKELFDNIWNHLPKISSQTPRRNRTKQALLA
jgi:transcriptional regulator with XRE-family HTH domain